MGLILELQKQAISHDLNIEDLLSQAYLVARKLKQSDFQNWIENEQQGYKNSSIIPVYRKLSTRLMFKNPSTGVWQDIILGDEREQKKYESYSIGDSIPSICDLLKTGESHYYIYLNDSTNIRYSNQIRLLRDFHIHAKFAAVLSRNSIKNIIEQVRIRILQWALFLEENGIVGEGLSFSPQELTEANKPEVVNYYSIVINGNASEVQIQQNSQESIQGQ